MPDYLLPQPVLVERDGELIRDLGDDLQGGGIDFGAVGARDVNEPINSPPTMSGTTW